MLDAGVVILGTGHFDRMLYDFEPTALGFTYITVGSTDKWLALCRKRLALGQGMNAFNRGSMVMALTTAGEFDEAKSASEDLLNAADATDNPGAQAFALLAYEDGRRDANSHCGIRSVPPWSDNRSTQRQPHDRVIPRGFLSGFAATNYDPMQYPRLLTLSINQLLRHWQLLSHGQPAGSSGRPLRSDRTV